MRGKFHVEILMVYDFTGGRISHFPIDFCMGLTTVQRKGAACDRFASVSLSVCVSDCPCVVALTVAFLCRFSPNLTQRCKLQK